MNKKDMRKVIMEYQEQELTLWSKFPEHNTDSPECWCEPEIIVDEETDNQVIIHSRFN